MSKDTIESVTMIIGLLLAIGIAVHHFVWPKQPQSEKSRHGARPAAAQTKRRPQWDGPLDVLLAHEPDGGPPLWLRVVTIAAVASIVLAMLEAMP